MATTRIMPIHPNMALGVAQTIKDVTDYAMNPAKTEGGLLVTGYECDPTTVAEDFMFSRDEYRANTGREQGSNEILVYHVRQSFLPGETDAETAAKLGYELAMELTGGNFSFLVCTHTDKPHLHNHIIISAVDLSCERKLRNELYSYKRIRRTADRISKEHNLSVVENPKLSKGTANRYAVPTKRDVLVDLVDDILTSSLPKDFDDLLKQLAKNGCKIKRRGKTISVQPPGAERYFRFRAGKKGLPDGYDEESLRKKIADIQADQQADLREETPSTVVEVAADSHTEAPVTDRFSSVEDKEVTPEVERPTAKASAEPASRISHDRKINLLIDVENSIKAQESFGYERWAKGFNLEQAAETLLFLQTHNLTDLDTLTQTANEAQAEYDALQKRINAVDIRLKENNLLQRHIGAYNKNRDVYSHYLRNKRNPKFRAENEKAIATVEEAKAFFDSLGFEKLPTIKALQAEYSVLMQEKNNCYQARNDMRRHASDLQAAKKNAELLLGIDGERDKGRTKKRTDNSKR